MGLCFCDLQLPYMKTALLWKCHSHGKQGFYFYINQQFQMGVSHMGRCILSKSHIQENVLSLTMEQRLLTEGIHYPSVLLLCKVLFSLLCWNAFLLHPVALDRLEFAVVVIPLDILNIEAAPCGSVLGFLWTHGWGCKGLSTFHDPNWVRSETLPLLRQYTVTAAWTLEMGQRRRMEFLPSKAAVQTPVLPKSAKAWKDWMLLLAVILYIHANKIWWNSQIHSAKQISQMSG